jgi:hypothetical protein
MNTNALPKPPSPHAAISVSSGDYIFTRIHEAFCALHGHDLMLHFEYGRICLRCVRCGHETPGWSTGRRDRVI